MGSSWREVKFEVNGEMKSAIKYRAWTHTHESGNLVAVFRAIGMNERLWTEGEDALGPRPEAPSSKANCVG